ncbi:GNAT family N-acetyltransferase [Bacillus safensis]|uniref:GNAT family N-acetyltransferase n=1 Tax=Bacillus TaxID=1386 RepID=UPI002DB6BAF1|nr:GNAT family N-acetyltransferase [Bacillus safensis]MBK4211204.1 GNAT family N-acetyltransferase [Bacillus pumilus]MEC0985926.1 GNAT family N-acetyltransferase [Bacillus safensis]
MLIREAKTIDYPQLRQICLESRRQSFHWLNPEELHLQDFDQDTQEEQIFLAEDNNKILGFISLYVPDRFIHLLFVHPEAAGQGAGDLLLKQAIKVLGTPVTLKCVSDNHNALSFYQKRGWKAVVEEGEPGAEYWVLIYE